MSRALAAQLRIGSAMLRVEDDPPVA